MCQCSLYASSSIYQAAPRARRRSHPRGNAARSPRRVGRAPLLNGADPHRRSMRITRTPQKRPSNTPEEDQPWEALKPSRPDQGRMTPLPTRWTCAHQTRTTCNAWNTAQARAVQATGKALGEGKKPAAAPMEEEVPVRMMRKGPTGGVTGRTRHFSMRTWKTDASTTEPKVGPKPTCPPSR